MRWNGPQDADVLPWGGGDAGKRQIQRFAGFESARRTGPTIRLASSIQRIAQLRNLPVHGRTISTGAGEELLVRG